MAQSGLPADRDVEWADRSPKASLIATAAYFATLVGVRILTTATHSGPGADIDLLIALAVGLVALVVNAWRSRHLIRGVYRNPPG